MNPSTKHEIERLIINWGYWMSGGGTMAGGIMLGVGTGDSWGEPRMPLLFGEARLTNQAMGLLLEPQVLVLKAHYLTNLRRPGVGQDEASQRDDQDYGAQLLGDQARMKADDLGLSRATFYRLLKNSQKSFWTAFQLVREAPPRQAVNSLDDLRRMSIIPATVV